MINNWDEVKTCIAFFLTSTIVVALTILVLFILSKKENYNKRNIYGYFSKLNKRSIYALSLIIINFIFLSFLLIFKEKLSILYVIISSLLIIIAYILNNNGIDLFINTILNGLNILIVYLANLVNVLRLGHDETIFYILQILMNVFGLLFFMFTSLKFIKNLNMKGLKNEGKI